VKRLFIAVLFFTLLMTGCSGGTETTTTTSSISQGQPVSTQATEPDDEEFMGTALQSLTGLQVRNVQIDKSTVTISYDQITDDSQTVLVKRWLDLATAAMSFMEEPQTVVVIPFTENSAIARVVMQATDVASFLAGTLSSQELLSLITIDEP